MTIRLLECGLMIEAQEVTIIISDETFDPAFWYALIQCVREGVICG